VRDDEGSDAGAVARRLCDELAAHDVRARLDDRLDTSFGRRVTNWELKGVPVRLEVGPRDLASGVVTVARRDTGAKSQVPVADVVAHAVGLLDAMQGEMLATAVTERDARIADTSSLDETRDAALEGWARVGWDALGREEGEAELAQSAVTVRCLQRPDGTVPASEDEPDLVAFCARAY
jgi:prolyl-tRNA synthetase